MPSQQIYPHGPRIFHKIPEQYGAKQMLHFESGNIMLRTLYKSQNE